MSYKFKSKADAQASGFIVDESCYPWIAYKGPRFQPTQFCTIPTDIEAKQASLIALNEQAIALLKAQNAILQEAVNAASKALDKIATDLEKRGA